MIDSISKAADASVDLKRARRIRQPREDRLKVDRMAPNSPEAEVGVLGCILISPSDCLPQTIIALQGNRDAFYDLRHQTIFNALMQMFNANKGVDVILLQQRLKNFDLLEQIGGIPYLNAVQDSVPSAANLTYYLEIVIEKWKLRRTVQTCSDTVGKVYEFQGDNVDTLLDEVERDVLQIRASFQTGIASSVRDLVPEAIQELERIAAGQGGITGISSGFIDLDKKTAGFQPGDMIVIAARPSLGKTSLAMNIADYVACDLKLPVGVFSMEMTKKSLVNRLISARASVNLRTVTDGYASQQDMQKMAESARVIMESPMWIDDTPALSIMALRARARQMWQLNGIRIFLIDYLQLSHSTSRRAQDNRQLEVSEISSGIKALAKELNVPVIVLSQLNRAIEQSKRKPQLSDLRESGSIEQDADQIGFLYRPEVDDEEAADAAEVVPINLLLAKNRNGPTGDIELTFLKRFTRFESASRVSDDEPPPSAQQEFVPPPPEEQPELVNNDP